MQLTQTALIGVYTVDVIPRTDERGMFARTWDSAIAREHGLQERFDYTCVSLNTNIHTLRGMHYQRTPHDEVKLVRCTRGTIVDVVLDLRPASATFKQWISAELTAENHRAVYVPAGCAHGFLTMEPQSEVLYHIAGKYVPDASTGVRFDDPAFGIRWPAHPQTITERDRNFPDFPS